MKKPVETAEGVYWLSFGLLAGNVFFVRSEDSWALVDTSVAGKADIIKRAAGDLFGGPPSAILLTHVHPDHAGSAPELARAWDCPVYVPPEEMPLATARDLATVEKFANPMDRWAILPVMRLLPRRRVAAILEKQSLEGAARPLDPGGNVPGLPTWTCIVFPGHTPGHVVFWREADRVLISGDAVMTVDVGSLIGILRWAIRPDEPRISKPARYTNWDHEGAKAQVEQLARLEPAVIAPGHGPPMTGPHVARALRSYAESLGVEGA